MVLEAYSSFKNEERALASEVFLKAWKRGDQSLSIKGVSPFLSLFGRWFIAYTSSDENPLGLQPPGPV